MSWDTREECRRMRTRHGCWPLNPASASSELIPGFRGGDYRLRPSSRRLGKAEIVRPRCAESRLDVELSGVFQPASELNDKQTRVFGRQEGGKLERARDENCPDMRSGGFLDRVPGHTCPDLTRKPRISRQWQFPMRGHGRSVSVTRRTSMTDFPGISRARRVSGAVPSSRWISPRFNARNSFICDSPRGRGNVS